MKTTRICMSKKLPQDVWDKAYGLYRQKPPVKTVFIGRTVSIITVKHGPYTLEHHIYTKGGKGLYDGLDFRWIDRNTMEMKRLPYVETKVFINTDRSFELSDEMYLEMLNKHIAKVELLFKYKTNEPKKRHK